MKEWPLVGRILLFVIIGWIVIASIGFVVHALLWLAIIACIGFVATIAIGGWNSGRKSINR
jgi:hypothetical protein